jgi:hypothetical protein
MLPLDNERIAKNKADILAVKFDVTNLVFPDKERFLSDKKNSLSLKYLLNNISKENIDDLEDFVNQIDNVIKKR